MKTALTVLGLAVLVGGASGWLGFRISMSEAEAALGAPTLAAVPPPPTERYPAVVGLEAQERGPGPRAAPLPEPMLAPRPGQVRAGASRSAHFRGELGEGDGPRRLVYVGRSEPEPALVALDADTGDEVWAAAMVFHPPATVRAGVLYARSWGALHALGARDGVERWVLRPDPPVPEAPEAERHDPSEPDHDHGERPAVTVFDPPVVADGHVWAVRGRSAWRELWLEAPALTSWSTEDGAAEVEIPLESRVQFALASDAETIVAGDGEVIFASRGGDLLTAWDTAGARRWRSGRSGSYRAAALLLAGLVVVSDQGRRLRALHRGTGLELWDVEAPAASPPALGSGAVFVTAGRRLGAYEVATGRERWVHELPERDATLGPPAVCGDAVVVVGGGVASAFAVTDAARRWRRRDVGDRVATAACDDDSVYVAAGDGVRALDLRTGEPRWHAPGTRATEVAVASGARR